MGGGIVALLLVDRNADTFAGQAAGDENHQTVNPADALTVLEQIVEDDRVAVQFGGAGINRAAVRQGFVGVGPPRR